MLGCCLHNWPYLGLCVWLRRVEMDANHLASDSGRLRVYQLETNKETMIALQIFFLCIPTLWELWNDRKGDFNKDIDVYVRIGLMAGASFPGHGFSWFEFASGFFLSAAIFFMFFDYLINIILYQNNVISYANWFSYTGKSGVVDNIPFWKKMNPWVKFLIRLVTLITAIIIYL